MTEAEELSAEDELHPERVPGAEHADAHINKFRGYLLNESHQKGASKAKFFCQHLGYGPEDAETLRVAFLEQLPHVRGAITDKGFGGAVNYEASVKIASTSGRLYNVTSVWEVHPQTGTKFLSAYPADADDDSDDHADPHPGDRSS